jgi:hypothetical protein
MSDDPYDYDGLVTVQQDQGRWTVTCSSHGLVAFYDTRSAAEDFAEDHRDRDMVCGECGATVTNPALHRRWHADLEWATADSRAEAQRRDDA